MAGGRMEFVSDQAVRYLDVAGKVSSNRFTVTTERSDRKGHIVLTEIETGRQIKVNQRRVLPDCAEGEAFVIQSGDRYRAVCPKCSEVAEVTPSNDAMECPQHGVFKLHWRQGERPMSDTTTTAKQEKPKTPKADRKPSPEKKQKVVREPIVVNLDELKKLKSCELWTKNNVPFDHERISVQAHVLLFIGQDYRKLCFNTYDGALGRKASALPTEDFCHNHVNGDGKPLWFAVKDIEKEKSKLAKDGYEKH